MDVVRSTEPPWLEVSYPVLFADALTASAAHRADPRSLHSNSASVDRPSVLGSQAWLSLPASARLAAIWRGVSGWEPNLSSVHRTPSGAPPWCPDLHDVAVAVAVAQSEARRFAAVNSSQCL